MHFFRFLSFLPKLIDLLGKQRKIMGFRIFFYRISKFIWGMSLADRPIICKKLHCNFRWDSRIQGSEKTSSIQTLWIQDSRFKAQKKTSSIQPLWTQDSRLRQSFFGILNLELYPLGFKKSFWDLESWILNYTPLDSRSLFGILNLESDVLREGWDGNKLAKQMQFLITKKCPKFKSSKC